MNKNIILSIVFGILLLIFFGTQFLGSGDDRNFRKVLVEVDTAAVTKIVLDKKGNGPPVTIEKTAGSWQVTNNTLTDEASQGPIESMLSSLVKMEPERLVAKSKERWGHYEVNDSLGTRVRVFGGDKLLADLVIGKGNMQRSSRRMSTFIRLSEEEEVYAVEGFLSSAFDRNLNDLRDKTFLTVEKANLTSLRFDYPGDSSFVLQKIKNRWQIDQEPADSAAVARYLDGLQSFAPSDFTNNFTPEDKTATYQLAIEGANMASIKVKGFGKGENLVLHSSLNENAFFKKGSLDVFKDLFAGRGSFLAGPGSK